MIDGLVAKRYAEALFEVAKEKQLLEQVRQDLALTDKVIANTEGFMNFFLHPQIDSKRKKEIINQSFADNLSLISKNLLFQLIDNHRMEFIEEILNFYVKLVNEALGVIEVQAITSSELSSEDKEKISQALQVKFNKEIRLNTQIDPAIIGGMIIKVGDRVYDGSIKKQLKVLSRSLTASRV